MAKKIKRKKKNLKLPLVQEVKTSNIYELVRCATQEETSTYVKSILYNNGIEFFEDEAGNIYNLDLVGVPLLSAHMDTVGTTSDYIKAYSLKEDQTGIISTGGVCGGDDKCGVHIILNILVEKLHKINFIFSTDEEIGCLGILHFLSKKENEKKIEDNCLYCLVLDRKGDSDIVCYLNYYGTKEFDDALVKVSNDYALGFHSSVGLFSDADHLSEYVSTANLSVGYYNPHTSQEYIDILAMEFAEQFVRAILLEVKDKFAPLDNSARVFGSQKWYDKYYSYGYDYYGTRRSRYGYDEYEYPREEDDYDYLSFNNENENDEILRELTGDNNDYSIGTCDACGVWFAKGELVHIKLYNLINKEFKFCPHCAFDVYDELGKKLKNVDFYAI